MAEAATGGAAGLPLEALVLLLLLTLPPLPLPRSGELPLDETEGEGRTTDWRLHFSRAVFSSCSPSRLVLLPVRALVFVPSPLITAAPFCKMKKYMKKKRRRKKKGGETEKKESCFSLASLSPFPFPSHTPTFSFQFGTRATFSSRASRNSTPAPGVAQVRLDLQSPAVWRQRRGAREARVGGLGMHVFEEEAG